MSAKDEIINLRRIIEEHNYNYYVLDNPTISDYEYDILLHKLIALEKQYPEYAAKDSPTQRVGGKALSAFAPVTHRVPMESLSDVFSFDEVIGFDNRVRTSVANISYVVEPKIDGLSVSLEYENGLFVRGSTRGDGITGEDVTENLKTIHSLPLHLENAPEYLVVRGEVYMSKKVFAKLNELREIEEKPLLANPRNAAAGSLRQLDPKIAAKRQLDVIVFNIQMSSDLTFTTHSETLKYLDKLKFQVVEYKKLNDILACCDRIEWIGNHREDYPFDIDGAVIKIDELAARETLGSTTKAPRWAVAYKYPPEKKSTVLRNIVIQVGRTGVLTPKAVVDPIRLAGTTVTSATLHNQDFITEKDIRIGDTVLVQKAGEIIPEVLGVIREKRTANMQQFVFPDKCPVCGSPVSRDKGGSAIRCRGAECPAQLQRNIVHFASRNAMDIEGLGISVVTALLDNNLIHSAGDLYYLDAQSVASLVRMGKKSAENLVSAIEKSKQNDLSRLLFALGIPQVGQNAAKALADHFKTLENIEKSTVELLTEVNDVGNITAQNIVDWFSNPQSRHLIKLLRDAGVNMNSEDKTIDDRFKDKVFVLTGALSKFTREQAGELIEKYGGKVSSSVSKKTNYILAGENAGSKLSKAESLGIPIISEVEFLHMIQ